MKIAKSTGQPAKTVYLKAALILAILAATAVAVPVRATDWNVPKPEYGYVALKGTVKGENGKPVWVVYDRNGDIAETIGEAFGDLANSFVMSAGEFDGHVAAYNAIVSEHGDETVLMTESEYNAADLFLADGSQILPEQKPVLNPDTRSAVIRSQPMRTGVGDLVLLESPIDLTGQRVLPDGTGSVLLTSGGAVRRASSGNIGYHAAFYIPADAGPGYAEYKGRESLYGYNPGDDLFAPRAGVRVNIGSRAADWSDSEGRYSVPHMTPGCPGFSVTYDRSVTAIMLFCNSASFNPRNPSSAGSWAETRKLSDTCSGIGDGNFGTSLAGQMAKIGAKAIEAASFDPSPKRVDFAIGVAMAESLGAMRNRPRPGDNPTGAPDAVPLGDVTEHLCDPPVFDPVPPPANADFDGDGVPDDAELWWDEVEVRFGDSVPADLIRRPDRNPDFWDRGLLKSISREDFGDTDIYVFRVSDGTLLATREGLAESSNPFYGATVADTPFAGLEFKTLMRGPASATMNSPDSDIGAWQSSVGMDESIRGLRADHFRAGERAMIVMVSRASGYVGTGVGTLGDPGGSGIFDLLRVALVRMSPPNLKIRIERKAEFETGEEREYLIGFEGSGLTSDKIIVITTEWTDTDGSPLPGDLPGFTGRFAKVVDSDTLGPDGQICNFPIRPGKHTQVVKLPLPEVDRAHFYVHVSGEPDWRNTPDFSETLGQDGTPEFRPDNFVPVRVPVFDEWTTNEQTNNLRTQLRAAQSTLDDARNDPFTPPETIAELEQALEDAKERFENRQPAYRWVYRPEAQFTAFDLEVIADEAEHAGDTIDPDDANDFGNVSILHSLLGPDDDPLAVIGPPRELVFSLAGEEIVAQTVSDSNEYEIADFGNPDHLSLLQADDLMVLRLIQNGDDANVLWEQSFCDFAIYIPEDEPYPIPAGASVQLAITPEDREVTWKLVKKEKKKENEKAIKVDLSPETGILSVEEDSGSGWILVRAGDMDNPLCYREQRIWVGCESCRDCLKPGQCDINLSCVDVRLSLGKGNDGRSAGELFLNSERLSADHGAAGSLVFASPTREAEALFDDTGAVRQIVAPRTFVDIVTLTDFGYEVRFYRPEAMGDLTGDIYEVNASAVPFSTIRIENPDASPDVYNKLRITENKGGDDIVSEYAWDEGAGAVTLSQGNALQIVMHEETINGDTKEVVRTVSDTTGHVASTTRL
ncbi:MAG: hypothetical protein GY741_00240, partial [Phycisphaeraceae bacterium]|nr:hypothetical protein [Phycisphaeraceae bacterium]